MNRLREVLICAVIAAAGFCLICIGLAARTAGEATRQAAASTKSVADSLHAIEQAVVPLPAAVVGQIAAARADTVALIDKQATGLRSDATGQIAAALGVADRRIGDTLARADRVIDTVQGLRADVQPVLAGAVAIEAHTDKAVTDLHPQLLGLVAASKVTAGQAALTLRDVQEATPKLLAVAQSAADHANDATEAAAKASAATQHTMENLAAASKPLPLGLRVFLQVAPGVAGIVGGVLESMAATGAIK